MQGARSTKKVRFSTNISLNMGNDTKQSYSYYIVTIEGECETVHDLLNGTSFNDLE